MVFQFWSCLASGDSLWSLFIAVSLTSSLCWFSPQFPPPPVLDQLIALPSVHTPLFPSPDCLVTVQSSFQEDIPWARFDSLCFSFPVFIPCGGFFSYFKIFLHVFHNVTLLTCDLSPESSALLTGNPCMTIGNFENKLLIWYFALLHVFGLFAFLIELIHHQMVIIIFGVITSHSKFNYSQRRHWYTEIKE